jgi:hypothetical protein
VALLTLLFLRWGSPACGSNNGVTSLTRLLEVAMCAASSTRSIGSRLSSTWPVQNLIVTARRCNDMRSHAE